MNNSEQERLGSFFEDPVFAEKCRNIHKAFTDRLAHLLYTKTAHLCRANFKPVWIPFIFLLP